MTDAEGRRRRLLEVAEARFRRHGYRRTTVDDVAADAGIAKGSVYLHFPSKEALYLAVVERSVQRFVDRATTVLAGRGRVPQRLRRLVEITAEHYGGDELLRAPLLGRADLVHGDAARLAARLQRDRISALIASTLREGAADGSLRRDLDPDTTAAVLFEVGWGVVRADLEAVTDQPLDVALDVLNTIVDRGLAARPRR